MWRADSGGLYWCQFHLTTQHPQLGSWFIQSDLRPVKLTIGRIMIWLFSLADFTGRELHSLFCWLNISNKSWVEREQYEELPGSAFRCLLRILSLFNWYDNNSPGHDGIKLLLNILSTRETWARPCHTRSDSRQARCEYRQYRKTFFTWYSA